MGILIAELQLRGQVVTVEVFAIINEYLPETGIIADPVAFEVRLLYLPTISAYSNYLYEDY